MAHTVLPRKAISLFWWVVRARNYIGIVNKGWLTCHPFGITYRYTGVLHKGWRKVTLFKSIGIWPCNIPLFSIGLRVGGYKITAYKAMSAGRLISPLFWPPPSLIVCPSPVWAPSSAGRRKRTHPHTNLSRNELVLRLWFCILNANPLCSFQCVCTLYWPIQTYASRFSLGHQRRYWFLSHAMFLEQLRNKSCWASGLLPIGRSDEI